MDSILWIYKIYINITKCEEFYKPKLYWGFDYSWIHAFHDIGFSLFILLQCLNESIDAKMKNSLLLYCLDHNETSYVSICFSSSKSLIVRKKKKVKHMACVKWDDDLKYKTSYCSYLCNVACGLRITCDRSFLYVFNLSFNTLNNQELEKYY